jgi:hypothetical protein
LESSIQREGAIMKAIAAAVFTASLLAAAPAIAGHEGHALDEKEVSRDSDAEACPPGSRALFDIILSNLQVQMEAVRGTDDPEERRRLLRNHLQTMREALESLAPPDKQAAPAGKGKDKDKEMGMGMMKKSPMHRDMEQRVDRLQKLLEQMIEHEQAEAGGDRG